MCSSGEIHFHIFDSNLYFLFSARVTGCPFCPCPQIPKLIYMWLTNPQRVLCPHLPFLSHQGELYQVNRQAECWTVIQIQTSDCCWQSLVGLQVAFICLLESSSPFSPSAVLTCANSIINSSRLQQKFQLLPPVPVLHCPLLWLIATEICVDAYRSPEHEEKDVALDVAGVFHNGT